MVLFKRKLTIFYATIGKQHRKICCRFGLSNEYKFLLVHFAYFNLKITEFVLIVVSLAVKKHWLLYDFLLMSYCMTIQFRGKTQKSIYRWIYIFECCLSHCCCFYSFILFIYFSLSVIVSMNLTFIWIYFNIKIIHLVLKTEKAHRRTPKQNKKNTRKSLENKSTVSVYCCRGCSLVSFLGLKSFDLRNKN